MSDVGAIELNKDSVQGVNGSQNHKSHLVSSVRKVREGKEFAKVFEARTSGRTSGEFDLIFTDANITLANLEDKYQCIG